MHKILERWLLCQLILQRLAVDAESPDWDLNNIIHKRMARPVQRKHANEAFDANYPDLNAPSVLHDLDEGYQPAFDEIKLFDWRACSIDDVPGRKLDLVEFMDESLAHLRQRRTKDPVKNQLVIETQECLRTQTCQDNSDFSKLLFRLVGQASAGLLFTKPVTHWYSSLIDRSRRVALATSTMLARSYLQRIWTAMDARQTIEAEPRPLVDADGSASNEDQARRPILTLSIAALGVFYGDIGSSPFYALKQCFQGSRGLFEDCRVSVLTPEIALILDALGGGQQVGISSGGAVLHEMPTVSDLGSVRECLGPHQGRNRPPGRSDHGDLQLPRAPGLLSPGSLYRVGGRRRSRSQRIVPYR